MLRSVSPPEILLHLRIPSQNRIETVSFWQIFHLLRHFSSKLSQKMKHRPRGEKERETWDLGFRSVKTVLRKVLRRQSLAFFIQRETLRQHEAEQQWRQLARWIVMHVGSIIRGSGPSPISVV